MDYAKMTGRHIANTPMLKKNEFQIFLAEIRLRNGKSYLKKVVSEKLSDLFMDYAKMTGRHVANTPMLKKNEFQIFLAEIRKS